MNRRNFLELVGQGALAIGVASSLPAPSEYVVFPPLKGLNPNLEYPVEWGCFSKSEILYSYSVRWRDEYCLCGEVHHIITMSNGRTSQEFVLLPGECFTLPDGDCLVRDCTLHGEA